MQTDILIVGTGAVATFYAARLAKAGMLVTMLGTWQEGLTALSLRGARVEGEESHPVQATGNPRECAGSKLALVLVKSWQTARAAEQLSSCLAEDGLTLTLQNGLGNDEVLARELGAGRVARGVTTVAVTLLAPGLVRLVDEGRVAMEAQLRLKGLANELRIARMKVNVVKDILPRVWGKLVVNAAINPLTALLKVKNGELLSNPPARELMGVLTGEAAQVAQALGISLPFPDPLRTAEKVTRDTSGNLSSMLQDILRGAPTEVDAINGAIVQKGKEVGVETAWNHVIWELVRALATKSKSDRSC